MNLRAADRPLEQAAALAGALASPARLRALLAIRGRELCACHLVELLGLDQSTVSRHLAALERAGLVLVRRAGRWAHYRRADVEPGSPAERALRFVDGLADAPATREDAARLDAICCAIGPAARVR